MSQITSGRTHRSRLDEVRRQAIQYLPPVLFAVAILLVWEGSVILFDIKVAILPAPSTIVIVFVSNYGLYLQHTWASIQAILVGFVVGSMFGILCGVAIFYVPFFRLACYPLLTMIAITPKVAFAPLLVIWFGAGFLSKITLAILVVFFPTLVNTYAGLTDIDENLVTLNEMYSVNEWFMLRKIRIPNALPYLVAGIKLGIVFAVIGTIVAEYIASSKGIGYLIIVFSTQAQTARAFAALLSITVLVLALYGIGVYLEEKLLFWYTEG